MCQRYQGRICKDGKTYYLGTHDTTEQAAKAYDDKCEEFGEGRPNQTHNWYNKKQIK